jgi:hypothetical protein
MAATFFGDILGAAPKCLLSAYLDPPFSAGKIFKSQHPFLAVSSFISTIFISQHPDFDLLKKLKIPFLGSFSFITIKASYP